MPAINNIGDTLQTWDVQQRSIEDLALSHVDRTRAAQVFSQARQIADELGAVLAEVRLHPHQDVRHDNEIIRAAQEKARAKLEPLNRTLAAIRADIEASSTIPQEKVKPDPLTVREIRARLEAEDPVVIAAMFMQAADAGDAATLEAITGCHAIAHPRIHSALAANPQLREQAALAVRYKDDPIARRVAEHRIALHDGLTAVMGDLQRATGAPDALAQAAGASVA